MRGEESPLQCCGRKIPCVRSLLCRNASPKDGQEEHIFHSFLWKQSEDTLLCLEFQECFSHSACPLVLGTSLLISEVIRIGLNSLFSPLLCCLSSPQVGKD